MNNENFDTVLRIAKQLDAIADYRTYKCPACGEIVVVGTDFDDDVATCECGEIIDISENESFSLFEYFEDALDVEIRCNLDKEYQSVRIMITCGGPNIYVDTKDCSVNLYWWTERETAYFSHETAAAIDLIFDELWECR